MDEARTLFFQLTTDDRQAVQTLGSIRRRLPGGSGPLLKSLGLPQYFAYAGEDRTVDLFRDKWKTPSALVGSQVPFPMIPLDPLDTFTSPKQAAIHLAYAALTAELEEEVAVDLWADKYHTAIIYRVEHYEVPILAVNFDQGFKRLGDGEHEAKFRLPREFQADAHFAGEEDSEYRKFELVLDDVPGLPRHDALFMVTNRKGFEWLRRIGKTIYTPESRQMAYAKIKFRPHHRNFTIDSFMTTAVQLQNPGHQFAPHLLNQDTAALDHVDMTQDIGPEQVRLADAWLHQWKHWNPEQKQVLDSIHHAKGAMVITKGVAGTGKTLLQSGLCMYFAQLGFKVLVAPPANENANHTAIELNISDHEGVTMFRDQQEGDYFSPEDSETVSPVRAAPSIRRLFASSIGHTVEDITEQQAQHRTHHHINRALSSIRSL